MNKYILYALFIMQFVSCKQSENKPFIKNKSEEKYETKEFSKKIDNDTIQGDFNADKIKDYIEIANSSADEKSLKIFLGNNNGSFTEIKTAIITNEDFSEVENPLENFFVSKGKPGEIIIGASCCANFKTTETYYYKYLKNDWFLYKSLISTVDDDFIPNINLEMNNLSQSIDGKTNNNQQVFKEEINILKDKNVSLFNQYSITLKSNYKAKSLNKLNAINFDEIAEMLYFYPLTENNLNEYNDIAYFNTFTKEGNISSIFLLKIIINKFPDRTVAYLNLGDSYWNVDNKEKAKESYKKYVDLMESQQKDLTKIPQRVYVRIK